MRLNGGRALQAGNVRQRVLSLRLVDGRKHAAAELAMPGVRAVDEQRVDDALVDRRYPLPQRRDDPHLPYHSQHRDREPTGRHYLDDLFQAARWVQTPSGEPCRPQNLTRRDIVDYLAYLRTVQQAKPSTVNRRLAALRSYARYLQAAGVLADDPTRDVHGVRQTPRGPRALSPAELRRLLRQAERWGNRLHVAVLTVLAETGLRVGELCALAPADVELRPRKGTITVREGKGGKYREVPLNAEARRALREYLEVRPATPEDQPLFLGKRGPLTASGVYRIVRKYADQAGLERMGPHVLRHTFATRYLEANPGDLVGLARLLGHESLNTVAIYTQPTMEDLTKRVENL